jgi:biopolymer transport protein ExbB/TolQ
MGILTGVLIILVAWTIYHFLPVLLQKKMNPEKSRSRLKHIKTIGTFGLITGITGQLIGLISAFDAVEAAGGVPPALLMGGLKVSMITTLYGIFIFMFSLILWFVVDSIITKKTE